MEAPLAIFKITCEAVHPATVLYTSDPGKALITGRCSRKSSIFTTTASRWD